MQPLPVGVAGVSVESMQAAQAAQLAGQIQAQAAGAPAVPQSALRVSFTPYAHPGDLASLHHQHGASAGQSGQFATPSRGQQQQPGDPTVETKKWHFGTVLRSGVLEHRSTPMPQAKKTPMTGTETT